MMDIEEQKQIQERLGIRKKLLDDVFHNMIIALERLETFLDCQRRGTDAAVFKATGMRGVRDLHDDEQNKPTRESMLGEVQLQCTALFFQTKIDDEKLFKQTMKYFMTDLLEWYGGRGKDVPYDEVEMYVLPIIVSLSRDFDPDEKNPVGKIKKICDDYVVKLLSMEDFTEEQKRKAVEEGFAAFIKAQHRVGEQLKEFVESGGEVVFSVHKRGEASDGYNRLMDAMLKIYDTTTPAEKVRATFTNYVEGLPEFTDEMIKASIASKEQEPKEVSEDVSDVAQDTPAERQEKESKTPQEQESSDVKESDGSDVKES